MLTETELNTILLILLTCERMLNHLVRGRRPPKGKRHADSRLPPPR